MLVRYEKAYQVGPQVVGGKGWNLARLQRYGFDVPDGFIVSTGVYRQLLEQPALVSLIRQLEEIPDEEIAQAAATELLGSIHRMILQTDESSPWYASLRSALAEELRARGWENVPLAVRSSATSEDSATASFAGMHDSFLNMVGAEEVSRAILRCYASLWSPRAVAYRWRVGVPSEGLSAAVLICVMIRDPVVAGVAFTADPVSGRRDVVVLDLAAGLGEAVVQGSVDPERVIVRVAANDTRILQGTDALPLQDADYLRLAHLAWRVHWTLGAGQEPQDIEVAFDGEKFWLLQARPVTSLPHHTFPPLQVQPIHWSNANFKDSIPNPLTNFTWSMVQWIVGDILFAAQEAAGYDVPQGMEIVRRFSGRAYFNVSAIQWAFYDSLGIPPEEVTRTMGGFQPEIEVPKGNPMSGRAGLRRTGARLRFFRQLWRLPREAPQRFNELIEQVRCAREASLQQMSRQQLLGELHRWQSVGQWLQPLLQLSAAYYGAWLTQLRALLKISLGSETDLFVTRLLAASGNVTSAEQGYRLWEIADQYRSELQRVRGGPLDLASSSRELQAAVGQYLREFGHRAVGEMEIANPRWSEDPSYLLEQLVSYAAHDAASSPRDMASAVRAEAESEIGKLPIPLRPIIRWMLRRVRSGAALREHAKSAVVASIEPLRRIALEVGRRLCVQHELSSPEEIWHLSLYELEAYLLGEWDGRGASAIVIDQQEQHRQWESLPSPPDLITWTNGASLRHSPPLSASADSGASSWSGTCAAPGQAQGIARILRDPREGTRLAAGEILVAPSTDPGWTPLFLRAAAIVMETGGYLSHGAVVAREFGLPAVVNVPGILAAIQDGDEILVDANRGRIVRLHCSVKTPSTNLQAAAHSANT